VCRAPSIDNDNHSHSQCLFVETYDLNLFSNGRDRESFVMTLDLAAGHKNPDRTNHCGVECLGTVEMDEDKKNAPPSPGSNSEDGANEYDWSIPFGGAHFTIGGIQSSSCRDSFQKCGSSRRNGCLPDTPIDNDNHSHSQQFFFIVVDEIDL